LKISHVMQPCPSQGQFIVLNIISLSTKLEDSKFTHYKDMKGNAKYRNLSVLEGGVT